MRLQTSERLETNMEMEGARQFTFSSDNSKLFKIVANLYTNKVKAIIRELSCNAVDSHVASGQEELPIEVYLPTKQEPYFRVQDYGVGLTEEEVYNIYTVVGKSTKENSNNQIGALGLGTKSPLFYADAFTIETVKDGIYNMFTCFLKDGYPNVLRIETKETEERNGVIVNVPVTDIDYFNEMAGKVYRPFKVKPIIKRHNPCYTELFYNVILNGTNWFATTSIRQTLVSYGGIEYPLDDDMFRTIELTDVEKEIISTGFVIDMPLGSLDIAPSREALSYDVRTVENLRLVIINIAHELKKDIVEDLNATLPTCGNRIDYLFKMSKLVANYSNNETLKKLVYQNLKLYLENDEDFGKSILGVHYQSSVHNLGYSLLSTTLQIPMRRAYEKKHNSKVGLISISDITVATFIGDAIKFVYFSKQVTPFKEARITRAYLLQNTGNLRRVVPVTDKKEPICENFPDRCFVDLSNEDIQLSTSKRDTADDTSRYTYYSEGTLEGLSYNEAKELSGYLTILQGEPLDFIQNMKTRSFSSLDYLIFDTANFEKLTKLGFLTKPILVIDPKEGKLKRGKAIKNRGIDLRSYLVTRIESLGRTHKHFIDLYMEFHRESSSYFSNTNFSSDLYKWLDTQNDTSIEAKRIRFFKNKKEESETYDKKEKLRQELKAYKLPSVLKNVLAFAEVPAFSPQKSYSYERDISSLVAKHHSSLCDMSIWQIENEVAALESKSFSQLKRTVIEPSRSFSSILETILAKKYLERTPIIELKKLKGRTYRR